MPRIAVVSKPLKPELNRLLPELIDWLREHDFEPVLDRESASYLVGPAAAEKCPSGSLVAGIEVRDRPDLPVAHPVLVIVLGGDGTLLAIGRIFAPTDTPILSVNLGSLGFLTEVRLANLYPTLEGWCENCCAIDARTMLHADHWRDGKCIASFEAVNDIVLSKSAIARMAEFAVELDTMLVARFRADGVIVAGSGRGARLERGEIRVEVRDALGCATVSPTTRPGSAERVEFLTSGDVETFRRLGTRFCGPEVNTVGAWSWS